MWHSSKLNWTHTERNGVSEESHLFDKQWLRMASLPDISNDLYLAARSNGRISSAAVNSLHGTAQKDNYWVSFVPVWNIFSSYSEINTKLFLVMAKV